MYPENLKTGDIIHCRGKRLIPKLIMWATKSTISHTALFIEIWGQPYIIEAQRNGVNVKPWDAWRTKYGYEFLIHRSNDTFLQAKIKRFSVRAMSKVGTTGYDFTSLLIRHPWRLITGKWRKRKFEHDKMYCSEYVAWTHGIEHFYRMTPSDLFEYCKMKNFQIIEEDV